MQSGYPSYRISKTGLNAVTRIFASLAKGKNILVNSVDPGWVRTDMGGANAPKDLDEGIDSIVWAATLPDGSVNGVCLRDRTQISW
jgi:NAD(P)-dependent dehydrogenase (short-subunit alcohol dehydrogenase family)